MKPDTTRWDTDSSDDVKGLSDLYDIKTTNEVRLNFSGLKTADYLVFITDVKNIKNNLLRLKNSNHKI
ncbi:MAG: hypothetical protein GXO47_12010 [Chlorobi bacterium]|nr:hypothetical protein [Chlorobiota bacterium]